MYQICRDSSGSHHLHYGAPGWPSRPVSGFQPEAILSAVWKLRRPVRPEAGSSHDASFLSTQATVAVTLMRTPLVASNLHKYWSKMSSSCVVKALTALSAIGVNAQLPSQEICSLSPSQ